MEKIIKVKVVDKVATAEQGAFIVCQNSDYVVEFEFDEQWEGTAIKTARFYYNFCHEDIVFEGNTCKVPILGETKVLKVGVFADNIKTTTDAEIRCEYSIKRYGGDVHEPTEDVYSQIMELLNKYIEQGGGGGISREEVEKIIADYLAKNPVKDGFSPIVEIREIENGTRVAITDINGTKSFDVLNGKDGTQVDLSLYQLKTDETLETESKEIVGAINEINKKFSDINTSLESILGV